MSNKDTQNKEYADYLSHTAMWKKWIDVQFPYRLNLKSLQLDNVLDVGCGTGRNLLNLAKLNVTAVGVDHNEHSVQQASENGLKAFSTSEFHRRYDKSTPAFNSLMVSHVLEHMDIQEAVAVLSSYLPYVKNKAKVVVITPQEAGYRSDSTHRTFVDWSIAESILKKCSCSVIKTYSFPFPRTAGKLFRYNEFVTIGQYDKPK